MLRGVCDSARLVVGAYVLVWSSDKIDPDQLFSERYISGRVKMWYHMDKHIFSLLLACGLVVLGMYTYVGVAVVLLLGATLLTKFLLHHFASAGETTRLRKKIVNVRDCLAAYRPVHFFLKADLKLIQLCRNSADSIVVLLVGVGVGVR